MVGGSNAELDEVRPDNDLSQGGVDLEAPVVTEEARMLYNVGGHGKRSADLAAHLVDAGKYITKAPRGLSTFFSRSRSLLSSSCVVGAFG